MVEAVRQPCVLKHFFYVKLLLNVVQSPLQEVKGRPLFYIDTGRKGIVSFAFMPLT